MTPPLTSARQPDHEGPARTPRAGPSPSPHSRSQRDAELLILDDVQHQLARLRWGTATSSSTRAGTTSVVDDTADLHSTRPFAQATSCRTTHGVPSPSDYY